MKFDVVQGDIAEQSADEHECESLVLPGLRCGVAGFDLAETPPQPS
jgi:O-acetyl-ADP-ribose deacetylase (regulator of RNase III)